MNLINLVKFCITLCCCWTAVIGFSEKTVYDEISTDPNLSKVSHSIKYLIAFKVVKYLKLVFKPIEFYSYSLIVTVLCVCYRNANSVDRFVVTTKNTILYVLNDCRYIFTKL